MNNEHCTVHFYYRQFSINLCLILCYFDKKATINRQSGVFSNSASVAYPADFLCDALGTAPVSFTTGSHKKNTGKLDIIIVKYGVPVRYNHQKEYPGKFLP
jgi:hypothetical protein